MNAPFAATALDQLRAELASAPTELFIDGKFVPAASGETFAVEDPATGQTFAHSAAGAAADIDAAVKAARCAGLVLPQAPSSARAC
jgi:phenylacetaldehyde dehydrogenase